jgi:hypothetical protein
MRHACGLKAVDPMARNKDEFLGQKNSNSQDDDLQDEETKQIPIFSKDLMVYLLKSGKDKLNKSVLTHMKDMPVSAPRLSRTVMWEQLIHRKLWIVVQGRQKNQECILPVIETGFNVDNLFPVISLSDTAQQYPEEWNVTRFLQRTADNPARKNNADLLIAVLEEKKKAFRKNVKGKPKDADASHIAELGHLIESKKTAENTIQRISEYVETLTDIKSKGRKRYREKKESVSFDMASQDNVNESLACVQRNSSYKYKHSFRARKVLCDSMGVAALPRRVQEALCGEETFDLDIKNLFFSILPQMLQRLELVDKDLFTQEFEVLKLLSEQRDLIIRDDLKLPKEQGKKLLVKVACGGSLPVPFETNEMLLRLQRAGRMFRWIACSLQPEVYTEAIQTKGYAEASCFAYLWNAVEDHILSNWVAFILEKDVKHLSLHFDGVRVDKERCGGDSGVQQFLRACEDHIEKSTGYHVELAVKKHVCFRTILMGLCNGVSANMSELLKSQGNCIYAALFYLDCGVDDITALVSRPHPSNVTSKKNGFRSYREVCRDLGIVLSPSLALNFEAAKKYLLHLEGDGNPHCVGIEYINENSLTVYDQNMFFSMTASDLFDALHSATDESTVILFEIACQASVEMEPFLDCFAGAGSSDDVDAMNLFSINVADDSAEEDIEAVELCDDGASVNVSKHLKDCLKLEVESYANKIRKRCAATECELCPFKKFKTRKSRELVNHLQRNHTCKSTWIASGTKQMKVILALYDSDTFNQNKQTNYLQRSSQLMRVSIGKPLYESNNREFDRSIVLLLDSDGPRYVNEASIGVSIMARRVGHTYYTRTFAEILLRESIIHHGRVKTFLPRLMMRGIEAGNEIIHLFPRKVSICIYVNIYRVYMNRSPK